MSNTILKETEMVAVIGERGGVSWRSSTILPVGTELFAKLPETSKEVRPRPQGGETMEFRLKAMAANYSDRHSWDSLDGETCSLAATEIAWLRKGWDQAVDALSEATEEAQNAYGSAEALSRLEEAVKKAGMKIIDDPNSPLEHVEWLIIPNKNVPPVAWQIKATLTGKGWEECTQEQYVKTLETGSYLGMFAGTKEVQVRELYAAPFSPRSWSVKLTAETVGELITNMSCGEEANAGTLWLGRLEGGMYGIHLSNDECPEEGSITLAVLPQGTVMPYED